MGNFNRDNNSGGNRSFGGGGRSFGGGGRSFGGDRGARRPEMHKATCSNCGAECELPFKPTGERPVFCRNCFAKNRGNEEGKSFGRDNRDDSPRPSFRSNEDNRASAPASNSGQLDAINSKLDRILEMLNPTEVNTPKSKQPKIDEMVEEVVYDIQKEDMPKVIVKKAAKKVTKKAPVKSPTETELPAA